MSHATVGAALRALRESRDRGVRAAATAAGLPNSTISRWESGDRTPDPVVLGAYLDSLSATDAERADVAAALVGPVRAALGVGGAA